MSRTLFWYILKDLLRIFLLTSAGLAGIMSFGGLLRPLTEHGLDAGQVGTMLGCFLPAMTTYSFPVAALFATSIVYGRLSADNELTACRSSGISYLSMTTPALVLGLLVALVSLLFLCFVVPGFTLRVERVIYSNLAQLVQNQIEKTHQIKMEDFSVSAQSARVLPQDPLHLDEQKVELVGPMIVTYTVPPQAAEAGRRMRMPTQFWTAKTAVAFIKQKPDEVLLQVVLANGTKFPRRLVDGPHTTVGITQFGPVIYPSPIKEDPKFMNIQQLKGVYQNPEESAKLRDLVKELVRQEQQAFYLKHVVERSIDGPTAAMTFREDTYLRKNVLDELNDKRSFTFEAEDTAGTSDVVRVSITRGAEAAAFPDEGAEMVLRSGPKLVARKVKIHAELASGEVVNRDVREVRVRAEPTAPAKLANGSSGPPRLLVTLTGYDTMPPELLEPRRAGETEKPEPPAERTPSFTASMMVPMPKSMWAPDPASGEPQAETTLSLIRGDAQPIINKKGDAMFLGSAEGHDARQVKLVLRRNGLIDSSWEAREMVVKAEPQIPPVNAKDQTPLLRVTIEGYDVLIQTPDETNLEQPTDDANTPAPPASQADMEMAQHKTFRTELTIPMPDSLKRMEGMTVRDFKADTNLTRAQHDLLNTATKRLTSKLLGEIHGRASFAISCLALVLVGCVLGMMFRSGNFLSAFAVSFIPAMLSIALIVTGQQICSRLSNGSGLGLGFIWGGNAIVLLLAFSLLAKLQRD